MTHHYRTFVSIGNGKQSFSRLLNAIEKHVDSLPKPILVQRGHTPFVSNNCKVVDFVNMDDFLQHVRDAELLILHAGAGSVLHSVRAGKRPILMPRSAKFDEIVNEHQRAFAKALHIEGKAIAVENEEELHLAIKKIKEEGVTLPASGNAMRALSVIKEKLANLFNE